MGYVFAIARCSWWADDYRYLIMQLDFLWKELSESYPGVVSVLKSATSVLEASNAVLLNYERPANQSEGVQTKRAEYGQRYYDQFTTASLEEFIKLFQEMRSNLQDNDAGDWSADARQWAVSTGLIAGNGTTVNGVPNYMWQDFLTREQFAVVLYRFSKLIGSL